MKQGFVRACLPLTVCAALVAGAAVTRGLKQAPRETHSASPDVVARVGDRVLTRAEAERLAGELLPDEEAGLGALPAEAQAARREEAVRAWACEEMLYQEGVRRGLDRSDPVVHRRVADLVHESDAASLAFAEAIPRAELEAFYAAHPDRFLRPAEVKGYHVLLRFPVAMSAPERESWVGRAGAAMGEGPDALQGALAACEGAGVAVRVPAAADRLETRERVARAFGREVAQAYLSDDALRGAVTVVGTDGTHLLHAVERSPEEAIPFAEAASQVEEEIRRERSEARYRALLRDLAARTSADLPAYVLAPR